MTVNIDPELREQFKTATAIQGTEMSVVVLQFIEQYVEKHLPASLRAKKKGGRQ